MVRGEAGKGACVCAGLLANVVHFSGAHLTSLPHVLAARLRGERHLMTIAVLRWSIVRVGHAPSGSQGHLVVVPISEAGE